MSSSFDLNIVSRMLLLRQHIHLKHKKMSTKQYLYLKYTHKYQAKLLLQLSCSRIREDIFSPCHKSIYFGESSWVSKNSMEK